MWKSVISAAAVVTLLTGPAAAFTLTNDDEETYSVQLILGEGDALVERFELIGGETASDLCMNGCTIRLSNGAESYFEGDMSVLIRGGDFAIDSQGQVEDQGSKAGHVGAPPGPSYNQIIADKAQRRTGQASRE